MLAPRMVFPQLGAPEPQETVALSLVKPRPTVRGKFFFLGEEKLYLRGVTYGTFRPDAAGDEFPAAEMEEADFAQMPANRVNSLPPHPPPPPLLLLPPAP